ncbi:MAG: hypothetical protein QOI24_3928 [Acidobacteriota bacterium]|jgi:hypothetical protein|nr:hypothetical protein [Acidobacteriota bacterium]
MLPRPDDLISPVDAEVHARCLIRELDLDRGTLHDHLTRLEASELVTPRGVFSLGYYFTDEEDALTFSLSASGGRIDFLLPEVEVRSQKWEKREPLLSAVAFLRQSAETADRLAGSKVIVHPSLYEHEREFSVATAFAVAAPAIRIRELEREKRLTVNDVATEFRLPRDLAAQRLETYRHHRNELLAASHTHHESMAWYRRKQGQVAAVAAEEEI